MITHYVNLVGWREIQHLPGRHVVDTASLKLLVKIVAGVNVAKNPGVCFDFSNVNRNSAILLTSGPISQNFRYHVLPIIMDTNLQLPESVCKDLTTIKNLETIIFGISSPKQNILALECQSYAPNADIHCLGAAVDLHFETPGNLTLMRVFSKLNLIWVFFLFFKPKRSIKKIFTSLKEILMILIFKSERDCFRNYVRTKLTI